MHELSNTLACTIRVRTAVDMHIQHSSLASRYPSRDGKGTCACSWCRRSNADERDRDDEADLVWDIMLLDEGHSLLKNVKNQTCKALNKLTTRMRVIITGTTMQNNFGEVCLLLAVLGQKQ